MKKVNLKLAISPAIEKAKSDQPAENIKQNGNHQLSPARRKSFKPKFLPPVKTSRKTKPNLKLDIVSKQYPFSSNLKSHERK